MRFFYILFLSLLCVGLGAPHLLAQQLVINEFSQGTNGTKEFIELLVVGEKTCTDSCMDIRGWIVDDNNGWCGVGSGQGIAPGCIRLAIHDNWSCVPYGAIIVLYNSGDKNTSITMPDDPTDANGDKVYIVPSHSTMLEVNNTMPTSPSSANFVYVTTGFTSGGNWNPLGLRNEGDAVILTSPAQLNSPAHAISYGSMGNPAGATFHITQSGAGRNYYLTTNQWASAAAWSVGSAPANETPGAGNTAANTTWINSMRAPFVGVPVDTNLYSCILNGETYSFFTQTLTQTGIYTHTLRAVSGCDSIVRLHLNVIQPLLLKDSIISCDNVVYNGVEYSMSTELRDTLYAALGCDSVYSSFKIIINKITPQYKVDTLKGCDSVIFQSWPYYTDAMNVDTIRSVYNCDSIYDVTYLIIMPTPEIVVGDTLFNICWGDSVRITAQSSSPLYWQGMDGTGNEINVAPNVDTVYRVISTNELGCSAQKEVKVFVQRFDVLLRVDTYAEPLLEGTPIQLYTHANAGYEILAWYPASKFGNQTATAQTIPADTFATYSIIAQSYLGCKDSSSLTVKSIPEFPDIFMPTAFSPNKDGRNDVFKPVFKGAYKILEFSVFDRWGREVYSYRKNQRILGWDGTDNGTVNCELGTYYYMLLAENPMYKIVKLKGDVTLVR